MPSVPPVIGVRFHGIERFEIEKLDAVILFRHPLDPRVAQTVNRENPGRPQILSKPHITKSMPA